MNIKKEIKQKMYHMLGFVLAILMLGCALSLVSWLGNAVVNEVIL